MVESVSIHGTCVELDGRGLLLRGKSGAGKSDLALRLIEHGAVLVSDDQVVLKVQEGEVYASPPPALAGLLEVRGVGICKFEHVSRLFMVVDLDAEESNERLPEKSRQQTRILEKQIARAAINPFEVSACAKIKSAIMLANKV